MISIGDSKGPILTRKVDSFSCSILSTVFYYNPLDVIQSNLVCDFLVPPPWALGRGENVKYHLISITKSISKILYQTLCLFSQMKGHLGHAPGAILWGAGGAQGANFFFFQTWLCGISNERG